MARKAEAADHPILFFSSRRRHTRSLCDWSSDVCSSDLTPEREHGFHIHDAGDCSSGDGMRSEERRVGKEDRSRRSTKQQEKKRQNLKDEEHKALKRQDANDRQHSIHVEVRATVEVSIV